MKRTISVLLAVVMLTAAILSLHIPASADSIRIRKVVSIVCDDSSSMNSNNKWAYANYALQAFCGMLNSDDTLFLSYLNDTQIGKEKDLSAGGIQNTINEIKNRKDAYGNTPFDPIEKAVKKLINAKDSNPNTQYWLVVITDGDYKHILNGNYDDDDKKKDINDRCAGLLKLAADEGIDLKITYLGIGEVVTPDAVEGKIFPETAANATQITKAMATMADRVSGRRRLDSADMQQLDDVTFRVNSSVPLASIVVFTQGKDISFDKATHEGQDIPKNREANLGFGDLEGGAYLLGGSQRIIPSGTYEIKFKSSTRIDPEDIIVLFEPALEMRMTVSLNGRELSDFSELDNVTEGDKISISCKIYEMGTDKVVATKDMPEGTSYEIAVYENGKKVKTITGEEMLLSEYQLKNVPTRIEASLNLKGFNPIVNKYEFTPVKFVPPPVYKVVADTASQSIKYTELPSNKDKALLFTVYRDSAILKDKAEIASLMPKITASDGSVASFTYTSDGKIKVVPTSAYITDLSKDTEVITYTCTLDSDAAKRASASAKLTVELPKYTVVPEGTAQSIKYNDLAANKDFAIYFTVYCDGNPVKDKSAIAALSPAITLSDGTRASFTYAADGRIKFVPTSANITDFSKDTAEITVTCTLEASAAKRASATAKYTVELSKYTVVPEQPSQSIRYTELSANKDFAVYFTVYCDGTPVKDTAVLAMLNPVITLADGTKAGFTYDADGRIKVVPTSAIITDFSKDTAEVTVTCTLEGERANKASAVAKFTVELPAYRVVPEKPQQSITYDALVSGNELKIVFTVYCEDELLTDASVISALEPVITLSDGTQVSFTYDADGRLVYALPASLVPEDQEVDYKDKVICTLGNKMAKGAKGEAEFTVLMAKYTVVPVSATESVKKTEWFGNTTSVSFYITKELGAGETVRLGKAEVESGIIGIDLDEKHKNLLYDVTVSDDGTITVTPYSDKDHSVRLGNLWKHWFVYIFLLNKKDVTVSIDHIYGGAAATIDVVGNGFVYFLIAVLLPLIIEAALVAWFSWWGYCIYAKPKFDPNTSIYYGTLALGSEGSNTIHEIRGFKRVDLGQFNSLRYRWKPTLKPTKISVTSSITVTASEKTRAIRCHNPVWYSGEIKPPCEDDDCECLRHPNEVLKYIRNAGYLHIQEIKPYTNDGVKSSQNITAPSVETYYVSIPTGAPDEQIISGVIFAYAYRPRNN